MSQPNTTNEDLWYLLLELDNSWQYTITAIEVILSNSHGQEVHAPNEKSALQAALSIYGDTYDTHWY